jgi:D-inositol-3-phosphate glycosyltransferase
VIRSVALISLHTSPLLQPGAGDAGGMNVYLHELAQTMADRSIDVVVFTRRTAPDQPTCVEYRPGYRVVHVDAGPPRPLPIGELPPYVGAFADAAIGWSHESDASFDVIHSHYWLSGWAGVLMKESLDVPLANSFHTLGRVKDRTRRHDEPLSSRTRTLTEEEVIARSNCVIASTPHEFEDLLQHYGASPERLCTSLPGVSHLIFSPGDKAVARRWLGLGEEPTVLFVGRIQPLKGLDIAVGALAKLPERVAAGDGPPQLVVVGGPSGPAGDAELDRVRVVADELGIADRVQLVDRQPHAHLAAFYRAADVLVMPSRSETFGLVAAEAQACGLPVVASAVGGLVFVVSDETSGVLVEGDDPAGYADALVHVLDDPEVAARLRTGAIQHAEQFSWNATANRLLELYSGISGR